MKLTDNFVETKLLEHEIPELRPACAEFERRIISRNLMRLIADWDVERDVEMPLGTAEIIDGVLESYFTYAPALQPAETVIEVGKGDLRCAILSFHYGMKLKDPIT